MSARYGLPYFMDWSHQFESKPFGVASMPGYVFSGDFRFIVVAVPVWTLIWSLIVNFFQLRSGTLTISKSDTNPL